MPHLHHSNSFRAIALLSMVTMLLSGCSTWFPMSVEERGGIPSRIRVTTETERVHLKDARLVGDTAIAGVWNRNPRSIRIVDIQLLERSQIDAYRTIGFVAGLLAVTFVVGCLLSCPGLAR